MTEEKKFFPKLDSTKIIITRIDYPKEEYGLIEQKQVEITEKEFERIIMKFDYEFYISDEDYIILKKLEGLNG